MLQSFVELTEVAKLTPHSVLNSTNATLLKESPIVVTTVSAFQVTVNVLKELLVLQDL